MHPLCLYAPFAVLLFFYKRNDKEEEPQPVAPLSIKSFSPVTGLPGDEVIITGSGFAREAAANTVAFGEITGLVTCLPTALKVVVPRNAQTDKLKVTVGQQNVITPDSFILAYPRAEFILRGRDPDTFTPDYQRAPVDLNGSEKSPMQYIVEGTSEYAEEWEWAIDGKIISTEKKATFWIFNNELFECRLVVKRTHREIVYRDTAIYHQMPEEGTELMAFPFRQIAGGYCVSTHRKLARIWTLP